jgi:hypothetical protein
MIEELGLRDGRNYNLDEGSVAVMYLYAPAAGEPARVDLTVAVRGEGTNRRYTLGLGDTFPIGGSTWMVSSIIGADSPEYEIRIRRVGFAPVTGGV